ncbi:MAG: hypothetical protein ACFFAY_11110, partial [Promethearchaeota archaeon]
PGSETEGFIIAKHNTTLHRDLVAPPVNTNYTPYFRLDPLLVVVVVGVVAVVIIIAIVWFRKQ